MNDKQNITYTYDEKLLLQKERKFCHDSTWMNLEAVTISEISQSQKD
jgi:hypothetical protein